MFMTAAERVPPPSPARADVGRSPFVRLRELLGDAPPGKPAISLAVGEPQHAIPSFVGPVIAAHVNEFGRYPMNKGLDAFSEAVSQWLNKPWVLAPLFVLVMSLIVWGFWPKSRPDAEKLFGPLME